MNREQLLNELTQKLELMRKTLFPKRLPVPLDNTPSPAQLQVIMHIYDNPGISVSAIAEILDITGSAATQHIDQLVRMGIVTRTEALDDRRRVTLSITPEAKQKIEHLKKHHMEQFMALCEPLSDSELEQFLTLLNKILHHHE